MSNNDVFVSQKGNVCYYADNIEDKFLNDMALLNNFNMNSNGLSPAEKMHVVAMEMSKKQVLENRNRLIQLYNSRMYN